MGRQRKQETFAFARPGGVIETRLRAASGQLSLTTQAGPPVGAMVSGIDPSKEALNVAAIIGDGRPVLELLKRPLFLTLHWTIPVGWDYTRCLFGGCPGDDLGVTWSCTRGYVLCEAQWAGDDAKEKWSGISALCYTSGALQAAAVSCGMGPDTLTHWSRDGSGNRTLSRLRDSKGVPLAYNTRGLGFIEPSAWRGVALSPRPITPRLVVRKVEAACSQEWLGRAVSADHAAAFGILLAACGLNYNDLGIGY